MSDTVKSPTSLVLEYLKANGRQPNAQNIRTVLEQNARDPTLIPGLRNDLASDNSGPGVGQSGSAARKVEAPQPQSGATSLDHPQVRPGETTGSTGSTTGSGAPTSSAQPTGGNAQPSAADSAVLTDAGVPWGTSGGAPGGPGSLALGATILGGLPLVGRYFSGSGQPGAAPPSPAAPPAQQPAPAPDPLTMSLDRATQPALGSGASDADLAAVLGNGRMPSGVSPVDAFNAGSSTPGQGLALPQASSQPGPGEGNIPITPKTKMTIETTHPPAPNFRTRPPMRLFVP